MSTAQSHTRRKPTSAAKRRPSQRRGTDARRARPTSSIRFKSSPTRSAARTRIKSRKAAPAPKRAAKAAPKRPRDPRAPSIMAAIRDRIRFGIGRQADDVWGLVLVVAGVLVALGFAGKAGPLGGWTINTLQFRRRDMGIRKSRSFSLGLGGALVIGRHRDDYGRVAFGAMLAFAGSLALFHLLTEVLPWRKA